jgi:hypothetical protein
MSSLGVEQSDNSVPWRTCLKGIPRGAIVVELADLVVEWKYKQTKRYNIYTKPLIYVLKKLYLK